MQIGRLVAEVHSDTADNGSNSDSVLQSQISFGGAAGAGNGWFGKF
jgi:hypothetical protein